MGGRIIMAPFSNEKLLHAHGNGALGEVIAMVPGRFWFTAVVSLMMVLSFPVVVGGGGEEAPPPLEGSSRAPRFENVSIEAGLAGYRGDNLAWGDYNNDGYLDLLVRGPSSNYLFRNSGPPDWTFTEVSSETGVNITRGYSKWADYNGDGYLDFYTAGTDDHLFRNNGPPDWDFTDVTVSAGNPTDDLPSEGIGWGDYNRDGYPDIYTVGWRKPGNLQWPYAGEMDRLYRNNGDGTFTDVSLAAGLRPRETSYAGMGVVWCDPNQDGWPDIYVSNYHLNPNQLWMNNRDGTFTDMAFEYNLTGKATEYQGATYYGHCNGAGWADIDNDRDMDLFVSHLAHKDDERSGMNRGYYCADSELFLNSGPPYLEFTDIREQAGIPITPSGTLVQDPETGDYMWKDEDYFGVAWGDMDNDGDLDLWIPQVKTYSFWDHSFLWENNGDLTFTDSTDVSNLKVWSNTGGTWVDYDNDGDLDFCTEGTYPFKGPRELHLFRNPGAEGHFVEIELKGAGGPHQTSTEASGSWVIVKAGGMNFTRYVGGDCGGHGFQQPHRLHFGLGSISTIDEVWVHWTSGRIQRFDSFEIDTIHTVEEPTTPWMELSGRLSYDVVEDQNINLTVTSSGAQVSSFLWDVDADGYERETASGKLSLSFGESGRRWVRVMAKDVQGIYRELEPIIIDVSNVRPLIDVPEELHLEEGQSIVVNTHPRDNASDMASLTFLWDMGDGSWVEGGPAMELVYEEMGDRVVRVNVSDDDGAFMTAEILVHVVNRVPAVNISGPMIIDEGDTARFTAYASDSSLDMDRLQFRFHSGDGRSTSWQTGSTAHFRYLDNGTFEPAVEVKDRHGDISSARTSLIVGNVPPVALLEGEERIEADEDEELSFTVDVTDTANDMDGMEYLWDPGDGSSSGRWTSGNKFRHTYTDEGRYTLNVTVRDGDGAVGFDTVEIDVHNVPPEIEIVGPAGGKVNEDSSFTVNGYIDDTPSDRDLLEFRWDMGDGTVTEWSSGDPVISHTYGKSGSYLVNLSVRDDNGVFTSSLTIAVENIQPSAKLVSSKRTVSKDSPVTFDAGGSSDTPSDMELLRYVLDLGDGNVIEDGTRISYTYKSGGVFNVKLTVIDDDEDSDTASLVLRVVDDPPVPDLELPESAMAGEIVMFDGTGSYDTATDLPNLTYVFDPGDGTGPVPNSTGRHGHAYAEPGEYQVTLTVSDGTSEESVSETITILPSGTGGEEKGINMAPVILIFSLILLIAISAVIGLLLFMKRKKAPVIRGPPGPRGAGPPNPAMRPPPPGSRPLPPPQGAPPGTISPQGGLPPAGVGRGTMTGAPHDMGRTPPPPGPPIPPPA